MSKKDGKRPLSNAEWTIMQRVWSHHPTTAREVLEALAGERSWAYTTVKTLMDRLVEKGALDTRRRGNTSVYSPLVSRRQARGSALDALLERAFGGALTPLLSFVADREPLSDADREALRALLDRTEARGDDEP